MKNQIFSLMDGTTPLYPNDPAVTPIVADAVAVANVLGSVVLGTATADFGRAVASNPVGARPSPRTVAVSPRSATWWPTSSAGRSTPTAPRDVDIAFMNPGGLRAEFWPRAR